MKKLQIVIVLLVVTISLLAQTTSISIMNCVNVNYNQTYTLKNNTTSPCYVNSSDTLRTVELGSSGWIFGKYISGQKPCFEAPFASDLFSSDLSNDILSITSSSSTCGSLVTILDVSPAPPPVPIPSSSTLSIVLLFGGLLVYSYSYLFK